MENEMWIAFQAVRKYHIDSVGQPVLDLFRHGRYRLHRAGTVANCAVIAPDDWDYTNNPLKESYSAAEWATAESSGLVCLPAAGSRIGSDLYYAGSYGNYWSATPYELSKYRAYRLYFNGSNVYPSYYDGRGNGYSVRLVSSVSN